MSQVRDENGKFLGKPRYAEEIQHDNIHLDHAYTSGIAAACSQMRGMDDYPSERETLSESDSDTISAFESDNESDLDDNADETIPGIPLFGRHIVELQVLGHHLKKGCVTCGEILQLSSCIGESRYGLGSILHIKCLACQKLNKIPTGKRGQNGAWDVNSKLGAAVLYTGIGETTVNRFLAALNLPNVDHKTLKKREREAGVAFEEVAEITCQEAIEKEKDSCKEQETVSYDAGWQTRGSGRNYASLSGHGSMIGATTGKVLAYAVRCKKCKQCDQDLSNDTNNNHDCRKNWAGSSKSMEPDMAVEMLHNLKEKGFHVKNLVMDNDTTTISKARSSFDPDINKYSDFNHTKKNFTNKLYQLKKEKKYALLGPKSIKHLTKCFAYVVKSNTDPVKLKKNLESIPCHVFGDHSECDEWCKYKENPEVYRPKNLPYSRYLTGDELFQDLKSLFGTFSKMSEKLINIGSTQNNESFNRTVASKNPKSHFYSGSESTAFRVASAVAQRNDGAGFISKVYRNLLLSPGENTVRYIEKENRKRDYQRLQKQSIKYKKRRRELKSTMTEQVSTSEIKEGATYQPAVDLEPSDALTEEIPSQLHPPTSTAHIVHEAKNSFLYFDLETTGLGTESSIVELACVCKDNIFHRYVLPDVPIHPKATVVTGLHVASGQLFHKKNPVVAVEIKKCLSEFVKWLQSFHNPLLVCHNGKCFDSIILVKAFLKHPDCGILQDVISGFVDSLNVFRDILPGRSTYKLETLVAETMGVSYEAHSATEDVKILQALVNHHKLSEDTLFKHSFDVNFVKNSIDFKFKSDECLMSLHPLQNCISGYMLKKVAHSGLNYNHLKLAFQRGGAEGIENILGEKNADGKVRVTRTKSVIAKIVDHFCAL